MAKRIYVGKSLIAATLAGSLAFTGAVAPQFFSAPIAEAATANTTPAIKLLTEEPTGGFQPGDVIQFQVSNYPNSSGNTYLLFRHSKDITDGLTAEDTAAFGPDFEVKVNGDNIYAYLKDEKLADLKKNGSGVINFTVPAKLDAEKANAASFLAFLGDGGISLRFTAKFQAAQSGHVAIAAAYNTNVVVTGVTASPASAALRTPLQGGLSLKLEDLAAGATVDDVKISDEDGTEVASISGKTITTGRGYSNDVAADGTFSSTYTVPAKAIVAQTRYTVEVTVGGTTYKTAYVPTGVVTYTNNDHTENEMIAGSTGKVTVYGLPDGATITGATINNNALTVGAATASAEGVATLADVQIPAANSQGQPLVVKYTINGTEYSTESSVVVEGSFAENVSNYTIKELELDSGLYQSAYDSESNSIFVTRAVGRPPIQASSIYKVDADTLTLTKTGEPPMAADGKGYQAVYGIAVDTQRGYVWVSNTRQNTIAVYDRDLNLLHQFADGEMVHSRDLAVEETTGKVYVTGANRSGNSAIRVFSYGDNLGNGTQDGAESADGKKGWIYAGEELSFTDGTVPMSLAEAGDFSKLYTINMAKPELLIITPNNEGGALGLERVDLGSDLVSASGVALDTKRNKVYVGGQGSNVVKVVDLETKAVSTIDAGASTLNLVYEPVADEVWAVSRDGHRVTVIDAETGAINARIPVGVYGNHVSTDGKGNVYVVNKAGRDGKDVLFQIKKNVAANTEVKEEKKSEDTVQASSSFLDKVKSFFSKNKFIFIILGILAALGAGVTHALNTGLIPPLG
ncbi:MAG: hypothetical protein Q3972_06325 [Corynebacterium sp.]|nr:hypothetical protein [Corynebacterium sp.]